jgi:hypothetical protein
MVGSLYIPPCTVLVFLIPEDVERQGAGRWNVLSWPGNQGTKVGFSFPAQESNLGRTAQEGP